MLHLELRGTKLELLLHNLQSMPASSPAAITCGHQLKPWELHAGVSVPSYACGADNPGFKGVVEEGAVYAVEPFNTTGNSGMIKNIGAGILPTYTSHQQRAMEKALSRKQLKPLGAQLAPISKRDIPPYLSQNDGLSQC